ncbi:hypothetical protein BH11MYX4_BH11MYX4_29650 [soil metagenome]
MLVIVLDEADGGQRFPVRGPLVVGRRARCDIRLDRGGVEDEHLRFDDGTIVALADCIVGGVPLTRGARRLAVAGVEVCVGTARFRLEHEPIETASVPTHQLALRAVADTRIHPRVLVVQGPGIGDSIELVPGTLPATVGRSTDAALVTNDATVSRQHVRISRLGRDVLVEDLGSQHGSWLGSARLAPHRVAVWPPEKMLRLGTAVILHLEPPRDVTDLLPAPSSVDVASPGLAPAATVPASVPAPVSDAGPPNSGPAASAAPVAEAVVSEPSPQVKRPAKRPPAELLLMIAALVLALGALAVIGWLVVG